MTTINIFYLDNNHKKCAEYHNDKHTVKMILEYAQLLSTAHRILDGVEYIEVRNNRKIKRYKLENKELDSMLYSATHSSHPSAIWCRQSIANYDWLHSLLVELCKEYTYRYGKVHKCERDGLVNLLAIYPKNLKPRSFTEPTTAMPDDVKVAGDSISSYRNYYIQNKQHLASWKGKVNSRNIPEWYSST